MLCFVRLRLGSNPIYPNLPYSNLTFLVCFLVCFLVYFWFTFWFTFPGRIVAMYRNYWVYSSREGSTCGLILLVYFLVVYFQTIDGFLILAI